MIMLGFLTCNAPGGAPDRARHQTWRPRLIQAPFDRVDRVSCPSPACPAVAASARMNDVAQPVRDQARAPATRPAAAPSKPRSAYAALSSQTWYATSLICWVFAFFVFGLPGVWKVQHRVPAGTHAARTAGRCAPWQRVCPPPCLPAPARHQRGSPPTDPPGASTHPGVPPRTHPAGRPD